MTKATMVLASLLAVTAAPLGTAALLMMPATASAQQTVSAAVGKPLKAAQDAIARKKWDQALNAIKQAQGVQPRTAYDDYKINELLWYVYLQQGKNNEAARLLEQQIASSQMPGSEKTQRTKTLAQLYFRGNNFQKALDVGNQYLKAVPGDRDIQLLNAQSYFELKNYKRAIAVSDQLLKGQSPPSQDLLQLQARSYYELKDTAGTARTLQTLLQYYPTADTWKSVLKSYFEQTKSDDQKIALYRLAQDVGALSRPDDYIDMTQALAVSGYAVEAQRVLEGALTANVFGTEPAGTERTNAQRTLDSVKRKADAERSTMPGAAKAVSAANSSGEDLYRAAKMYFSAGDYAKATGAVQKALAKGGFAKVDDAQMLQGMALSRSSRKADAIKAFDAIKDPKYAEIARLWKLAAR
jgi:tetratricopeptide (TPR) repeat protein